ncbi:hypothetical protein C8R44DRAFT_744418 [Mycena epipterygia]|nr:hypothetical protein C8R44DRAFT_744418 [Mycena epipterygia]
MTRRRVGLRHLGGVRINIVGLQRLGDVRWASTFTMTCGCRKGKYSMCGREILRLRSCAINGRAGRNAVIARASGVVLDRMEIIADMQYSGILVSGLLKMDFSMRLIQTGTGQVKFKSCTWARPAVTPHVKIKALSAAGGFPLLPAHGGLLFPGSFMRS